jgi:transcriptional regulator with XRE-family HTH domain
MELVDRVKYIMKLNQLSASQFADEIGVQRSSISHVLTGRNKPSLEFIQKIIKRYPKVDASWLIDGSTNVVPKQNQISSEEPNVARQEKEHVVNAVSSSTKIAPEVNPQKKVLGKKIKRILVFYEDNTFEEFNPL